MEQDIMCPTTQKYNFKNIYFFEWDKKYKKKLIDKLKKEFPDSQDIAIWGSRFCGWFYSKSDLDIKILYSEEDYNKYKGPVKQYNFDGKNLEEKNIGEIKDLRIEVVICNEKKFKKNNVILYSLKNNKTLFWKSKDQIISFLKERKQFDGEEFKNKERDIKLFYNFWEKYENYLKIS